MKAKAAPQADVKARVGLVSVGLLAIVGLMSLALAGTAVAAPAIGKGGKISACYRVKGKAKGAMRVVPANKKCRRGERKLAWNVAGPTGSTGQAGAGDAVGGTGATGTAGSPGAGNEAALQAKIASLTLKMEGLEGILQGVTNGDLTGTVAKLQGLTNGDLTSTVGKLSGITAPELTETVGKLNGITGPQLTETVGALPVVSSLCTQASSLPTQVNSSLSTALSGLSLGGTIPPLLSLTVPTPTPLTAYTCPS